MATAPLSGNFIPSLTYTFMDMVHSRNLDIQEIHIRFLSRSNMVCYELRWKEDADIQVFIISFSLKKIASGDTERREMFDRFREKFKDELDKKLKEIKNEKVKSRKNSTN